jgi:hypothetical protein
MWGRGDMVQDIIEGIVTLAGLVGILVVCAGFA